MSQNSFAAVTAEAAGVLVMRLDIGRGLGFAGYTLSMLIVLAIVIA
jgi:hypothetical protein